VNLVALLLTFTLSYAALLVSGIALAVWLPKLRVVFLAIFALITIVPLIVISGNYARSIGWLDEALNTVWPDGPIRKANASGCDQMRSKAIQLVDKDGAEDVRGVAVKLLRCSVQTVVNIPNAPALLQTYDAGECWRDRQSMPDRNLCYKLAFLEFRRDGALRSKEQLAVLKAEVADWIRQHPGQDIFTIEYIHGWRHDAEIGDGDVRRLRVIASFAAANLSERCRVTLRRCGALVLAVYIGWPGSVGYDGDTKMAAALNAPSFPERKRVSDTIGNGILRTLDELYVAIHPTGTASSTLLLAHSLGGNIVLSATRARMKVSLALAARSPDEERLNKSVVGRLGLPADLTVLLNPASEERKLRELRADMALFLNPPGKPRQVWSITTAPRLMLLASRCEVPLGASYEHGTAKAFMDACDDVVESVFPLSQKYAERKTDVDDFIGVGHTPILDPRYRPSASHFLEVNFQNNGSNPTTTSYAKAHDVRWRCFAEPGWLYHARARGVALDQFGAKGSKVQSRYWDTGPGKKDITLGRLADVGLPGQANIQFGYPSRRGTRATDVQPYDPIWSIDADPTAVSGHSGIASASLTCAYIKLLLDGPTLDKDPNEFRESNRKDFLRLNRAARKSALISQ
jgi:hypothetical protein